MSWKTIIGNMLLLDKPGDYWQDPPIIFPELVVSKKIVQRNNQTVFDHTMDTLNILGRKNQITLWACLFHDLGKIDAIVIEEDGRTRFPSHELISAEIAKRTLLEWNAQPFIVDRVCRIVQMHMTDIRGRFSQPAIRSFIAKVGMDNIENWFAVRLADAESYSRNDYYVDTIISPFRELVYETLESWPDDTKPQTESFGAGLQLEGDRL